MPIYEFICPVHGKFERYAPYRYAKVCPCPFRANTFEEPFGDYCEHNAPRVEFSVPARRNPEHGVQK